MMRRNIDPLKSLKRSVCCIVVCEGYKFLTSLISILIQTKQNVVCNILIVKELSIASTHRDQGVTGLLALSRRRLTQ